MTELTLDVDGPLAPPRANGELVFDAPWQSRVFGLTAALVEAGHLSWSAFQRSLIGRVGTADAEGRDDYWGCWNDALADCCAAAGLVDVDQWRCRVDELASRPAGHDHDHDHDHGAHHHALDVQGEHHDHD